MDPEDAGDSMDFVGMGGFLPGLFIGGALGWGLGPYYYYPPESEAKKAKDFDKCHDWAVVQTGFDPAIPPAGAPDAQTIQKSGDYFRAMSACLDARGYSVR